MLQEGRRQGRTRNAHDHHDHDPHVWLSPDIAKKLVTAVKKELSAKYPNKASTRSTTNATAYIAKLDALKEEGKTLLAPVRKADRKLVTAHGSMNYFASCFDVTVSGVVQLIPGQEPGSTELKALIALCTKENVRVFAAEPQFGTHGGVKVVTEALASKGIAKPVVIELDPLGNRHAGRTDARLVREEDAGQPHHPGQGLHPVSNFPNGDWLRVFEVRLSPF